MLAHSRLVCGSPAHGAGLGLARETDRITTAAGFTVTIHLPSSDLVPR